MIGLRACRAFSYATEHASRSFCAFFVNLPPPSALSMRAMLAADSGLRLDPNRGRDGTDKVDTGGVGDTAMIGAFAGGVDAFDGFDGSDGVDAFDGSDGFDGADAFDGFEEKREAPRKLGLKAPRRRVTDEERVRIGSCSGGAANAFGDDGAGPSPRRTRAMGGGAASSGE